MSAPSDVHAVGKIGHGLSRRSGPASCGRRTGEIMMRARRRTLAGHTVLDSGSRPHRAVGAVQAILIESDGSEGMSGFDLASLFPEDDERVPSTATVPLQRAMHGNETVATSRSPG